MQQPPPGRQATRSQRWLRGTGDTRGAALGYLAWYCVMAGFIGYVALQRDSWERLSGLVVATLILVVAALQLRWMLRLPKA